METKSEPLFTVASFTRTVERLVRRDELRYAEAIMHICETHEIEPEDIARLVKGPLKAKIELEAMRRNIIPSTLSTGTLDL
jgi:hypothetical protein